MNLWTAFILGFAGSLHCLGMCGPLALALPGGRDASTARRVAGRAAYNLGRILTYAIFGLFAGQIGHVFRVAGFQQTVSLLLGVLLLLAIFWKPQWLPAWIVRRVHAPLQRGLGRMLRLDGMAGLFQVGLLNGLLPCGLVYAAMAGASLQGGPLGGAAYMALFGLGTAPMMFALSLGGLSLRSPRWQPILRRVIPAVTLVVATLLILRGLALDIPFLSPDLAVPGSCCPH